MDRALLAGEFGAALLEIEAVDARTLQEIDAQFPITGDFGLGLPSGRRRVPAGFAQYRRDRVADLRRLARLQLERIDRDRVLRRRVVVEHKARLAVELLLPQCQAFERILPAVPKDAQPRHPVDAGRLDQLTASAVQCPDPLGDDLEVVVPLLPLGGVIALLEPMLDRGQHTNDVLLRDLHRAPQSLVRRGIGPGRPDQLLRAEQQTAGLRTAQELTAAVDDEIRATDEP